MIGEAQQLGAEWGTMAELKEKTGAAGGQCLT